MTASLTLSLQSAARSERIDGVASFVGRDASGSFGILPGRARLITVLDYGLARFRPVDGDWRYLACPGGVLYLDAGMLFVSTRRYVVDTDFDRISAVLAGQLAREEAALADVKDNLRRLEQELFRRLGRLERGEVGT